VAAAETEASGSQPALALASIGEPRRFRSPPAAEEEEEEEGASLLLLLLLFLLLLLLVLEEATRRGPRHFRCWRSGTRRRRRRFR